jgi:hypothetical protein
MGTKLQKIGLGLLLLFGFIGIGAIFLGGGDSKGTTPTVTSQPTVSQPTATNQSIPNINTNQLNDSQPVVSSSAQETQEQQQEEVLPKIDFSGSVQPSLATVGEKVVIKVQITNLDSTYTIDGIRLLFSDEDFLEQGLIIVNVMSGGEKDTSRSFKWNSDLMKIAPKQTKSFVIVAQANIPGDYESIISIKEATGLRIYSDTQGNEELVAKLIVTN